MDVEAEKAAAVAASAEGKLEAHVFARMFPMISDEELVDLAESIAGAGLLERIVIFQGQILDGRNRYRAIVEALQRPLTEDELEVFAGDEEQALEYVKAKNLNRRHLTASQRAMLAAEFAALKSGEQATPSINQSGGVRPADRPGVLPTAKIADAFGVSDRMVQKARTVRELGAPHIQQMVAQGELAVDKAAVVAKMPKAKQKKITTPEKAADAAKAAGKDHSFINYSKRSEVQLVETLAAIIEEIDDREPERFAGHVTDIDKALQQLVVVAGKVSEAAKAKRRGRDAA